MLKRNEIENLHENIQVSIPRTVVICTDLFTEFMEMNNLYEIALSDLPDEEILRHFLKGRLPRQLLADLYIFLGVVNTPVTVRSSSLLEDSHYQPFAGIYSTYMVPYDKNNRTHTLMMLTEAIKGVYASVYYQESKAYMTATKNVIDEEKMAVVLQETCGTAYNNKFYPSFSGVARSLNYYPVGSEKPEEGIANIALGLGKYIVDGGQSLRFSPAYPEHILQLSSTDYALKQTQQHFNALDIQNLQFIPQTDDGFNILKLPLKDAETDGTLKFIASTFDPTEQVIHDGLYPGGRKLITFANILKHKYIPLAEILKDILRISVKEMGRQVEIEFAVNLDYTSAKQHNFYFLQIRPMVDNREVINDDLSSIQPEQCIIKTEKALGHGVYGELKDIIYVRQDKFNPSKNRDIMVEIEKLNRKMLEEKKNYILIGPGRWGSSDPWLGIPVKWTQISQAQVIVEAGLSSYRVEPSQGTHFFQNLSSFGVSYFTINTYINEGMCDTAFLDNQKAVYESAYVRHIRFECPVIVKVDGRKNTGVILKPGLNQKKCE
jgi:hypothetical protein